MIHSERVELVFVMQMCDRFFSWQIKKRMQQSTWTQRTNNGKNSIKNQTIMMKAT